MRPALFTHLTRRFLAARPLRFVTVVTGLTTFLVTVFCLVMQSFQVSHEQDKKAYNSDFDFAVELPLEEAAGSQDYLVTHRLVEALASAGGQDVQALTSVYGVAVHEKQRDPINLYASQWNARDFSHRFTLVDGRLPRHPGEIAISTALDTAQQHKKLTLAGDFLDLKTVGVVRDEFSRHQQFALMTRDTWEAAGVPPRELGVDGQVKLYWNAPKLTRQQLDAIVTVVRGEQPDSKIDRETLARSISKQSEALQPQKLYPEVSILTLLATLVGTLLASFFAARFILRIRLTLFRLGITRVQWPGTSAILLNSLLGSLLGFAAGILGGLVLRLLLDSLSAKQIGPIYGIDYILSIILIATVLGSLIGAAPLFTRASLIAKPRKPQRSTAVSTFVPPVVSAGLIFLGWFLAQEMDLTLRLSAPFVFGAAFVVFGPLLLMLLVRIPTRSPAATLGKRRITAHDARTRMLLWGFSAILMLSFSLLTLSYSTVQNQNREVRAMVAPNQAVIHVLSLKGSADEVAQRVSDYTGARNPFPLGSLEGTPASLSGRVVVVDDIRAAEKLLRTRLPAKIARALNEGSLLSYDSGTPDHETIERDGGGKVRVPVVHLSSPPELYDIYGKGLMLRDGALKQKIPVQFTEVTFTGLTPEQQKKMKSASNGLNIEPGVIDVYRPPRLNTDPPSLLVIAAGAGVLAGAVISFYVWGAVKSLRPTLGALRALGVPRRFAMTVLVTETGVFVCAGLLTALIAGLLSGWVGSLAWQSVGAVSVPWLSLAVVGGTSLLTAAVALVSGSRKITASDRFVQED